MQLILYIIIGFVAQMIDGVLGMAYGVTCRTFLKSFGNIPSGIISAVIHYAEVPTSFVSMLTHIKYKNIDYKLFINLVVFGMIGGVLGAYIITLNFDWIELTVNIYLIIMGVVIFSKGITKTENNNKAFKSKYYSKCLGFVGAFLDSIGGGGWGPIVTASLLSKTNNSKKIIGTVNSSEFFVTLSSSITFILFITNIKKYLLVIIGLIIGGILAAPISIKLCQKIDDKKLCFIIGILLIALNVYSLVLMIV